jgi:ABC-type branched-subunit amino acid transport system ATPase component
MARLRVFSAPRVIKTNVNKTPKLKIADGRNITITGRNVAGKITRLKAITDIHEIACSIVPARRRLGLRSTALVTTDNAEQAMRRIPVIFKVGYERKARSVINAAHITAFTAK